MKSSPLKVTAGGVTPQTEQEPVVEKPKKNTKVADAIVDFVTPDSIGEALMNFIPFGGVGGKAISKTKVFQQLMKKVPGLEKMFKSGKTITKKQKFDFQKGLDDGLKSKGGVANNYDNLSVDMARHNNAIDDFDKYRRGIKTKFKGKVSEAYEKAGKTVDSRYFKFPQNMMDNFPLEERLKYLSKNPSIKDDWMFRGGVTKKGNKYFDVDGIEIPLDYEVSYVPPNLRNNTK